MCSAILIFSHGGISAYPSGAVNSGTGFRGSNYVYDEDIANLDDGIRRLKIEYDIFFSGFRKKPPDDLRFKVEKILKRLSEATDMSLSQRFRFNTLIARYYVYRDRWRRTQQDREFGIGKDGEARVPTAKKPGRTPTQPAEMQIVIADPKMEPDKIQRLYDGLLRMRGENTKGSPSISYQQFSEYIETQTHSIKQRYQCARVMFRIAIEENSIKFTAKADTGDLR